MKPFQSWTEVSTKMTPFQSRVVAAWIIALPMAYGLLVDAHHRIARLTANPTVEVAAELHRDQRASFVGFFFFLFVGLVIVTYVIDALANLIRRLFPDPPPASKPDA